MLAHTTSQQRAPVLAALTWCVAVLFCPHGILRATPDPVETQGHYELLPFVEGTREASPILRTVNRITGMQGLLAKDSLGRIYMAGATGLRRFDGFAWTELLKADQAGISALAIDEKDQVWVGNTVDLGCFKPQPDGSLKYESIMPLIPPAHRKLAPVWSIHPLADEVYFTTSDKVFRLAHGKVEVLEIPSFRRLFTSCSGDGRLMIHSRGQRGLLALSPGAVGPELILPQEKLFRLNDFHSIAFTFALEGGETLLCSHTGGVLILGANGELRRSGWESDSFLTKCEIEHAIRLSDGNFAFATIRGGVLITNRHGKPLHLLNREKGGLSSNHSTALLESSPGHLLIATQRSLMEWDFRPGLGLLDERNEAVGFPMSLGRLENILWLGSDQGLQKLISSPSNTAPARLEHLQQGRFNYSRSILSIPGALLSADIQGYKRIAKPQGAPEIFNSHDHYGYATGGTSIIDWGQGRILFSTSTNLFTFGTERLHLTATAIKPFANTRRLLQDPANDQAALAMTVDGALSDRKSTRLNSSHSDRSRMPSSA